jgi:hypothetical protein
MPGNATTVFLDLLKMPIELFIIEGVMYIL